MYSTYSNTNDSRTRDGTSSMKPAIYQTYGQPTTSDAYYNSRHTATVSVPRSQGRPNKYYPENAGSGYSRRGEYSSNQNVSSTAKVAGRRDHATRFEETNRLRDSPDRRDTHAAGTRRGDVQDEDSGSDVKGFVGARHRDGQEIPQRRGSGRQSRHDADAGQHVRPHSDYKRNSAGSLSRSYDNDNGRQNYDHRRPDDAAGWSNKSSRHAKEPFDRDDRNPHVRSGVADRKHSASDHRKSGALSRNEHPEDEESNSDIRGAYGHGARRNSSPPPYHQERTPPAKDKYNLSRQSTSQAHAAMTSGNRSLDRHGKSYGSHTANEGRLRDRGTEKSIYDLHDSDRQAAHKGRHETRGDRPRHAARHAYGNDDSASDSEDRRRSSNAHAKHSKHPSAGRHGSSEYDDAADSLNKPFTGLRLRRVSAVDDDDDDINGVSRSRGAGPRSARHAPGSGRPPRPRPNGDDDIGGTFGSRHV